jgi:hypothetical protein
VIGVDSVSRRLEVAKEMGADVVLALSWQRFDYPASMHATVLLGQR